MGSFKMNRKIDRGRKKIKKFALKQSVCFIDISILGRSGVRILFEVESQSMKIIFFYFRHDNF